MREIGLWFSASLRKPGGGRTGLVVSGRIVWSGAYDAAELKLRFENAVTENLKQLMDCILNGLNRP